VLVVIGVAAAAYTTGAAQAGQAVNVAAGDLEWAPYGPGSPLEVVTLWGDRTKGEYGMLLKVPGNFELGWHTHTADYHGLAVQGTWVHTNADGQPHELPAGSYALQPGKQPHNDACKGSTPCIVLIHQHAAGDYTPVQR
jgi:hypothetical protein